MEKDLGVYISSDLKVTKQCIAMEKKAMRILGYIKWHFSYRDENIVIPLFKALVRPFLEYAVQFWSPDLKKDIIRLEKVQARATKLIPKLRNLSYEQRLDALDMYSLEMRRQRGQLIQVFKMLHNLDNVEFEKFFTLSNNATRNNGFKLEKRRYYTSASERFFSYSIINTWNSLPPEVVTSTSMTIFKKRLDIVLPRYKERDQ